MPSEPESKKPPKMLNTISILKWTPDLDKIQEILDGNVLPQKGDVVSQGGRQWPTKPE